MPNFDHVCADGHETRDLRVAAGTHPPCPVCGAATAYLWDTSVGVIDDNLADVPGRVGGMWIENMGHEPVWVESKTQFKRECETRGLIHNVRHERTPRGRSDDPRFYLKSGGQLRMLHRPNLTGEPQ